MSTPCVLTTVLPYCTDSLFYLPSTVSSGQPLPCQADGQPCAQQICPNTAVKLMCNVPGGMLGTITRWMTSSPSCILNLDQSASVSCGTQTPAVCASTFTATNSNPIAGYCNASTLSFVMSSGLNGTMVTCTSTGQSGVVIGTIGSTTMYAVGKATIFYRPEVH